jgi:hypothetical protein
MKRSAKIEPVVGPAPTLGGPVEELVVERASASPIAKLSNSVKRQRVRLSSAAPVRARLSDLQLWFTTVIMHPKSEQAGVNAAAKAGQLGIHSATELERIVTAGPQCSALERLQVYHYAYHARLIECLVDDFPSLGYVLGEKGFEKLARAVIQRCPSLSPDLNRYGARLLTYLESTPSACPDRLFVLDLARIEWAMVEVLHAQAAPVLSAEALQKIPTEQWGELYFTQSATAQLVRGDYPANAFLQAFREDRLPKIPQRQTSATAVYRQGFAVWRMDLTPPMAAILEALWAGAPLATALATLEHTTTPSQLPTIANQVMVWFREWVKGGLFASCSLNLPPVKVRRRQQPRVANKRIPQQIIPRR